ncbi:MAG: SIMPL domain-containing protein [Gaiellaceae bacterium]
MKLRLAALVLAVPLVLVASACGSSAGSKRTISVSGSGTVKAPPDLVEFDFGVSRTAATAKAAMSENSKAMQRLIVTLKAGGIVPRDMQTQQVSVYPQTNANGTTTGFIVSNSVHVKLHAVEKAGTLVEQAVAAGANNVNGPSFSRANPDALTVKALELAYDKARAKAAAFAQHVGLKLGKPVSIQESGEPGVVFSASAPRAAKDSSVPIEPGQTEVSASVSVSFELT